MVDKIDLIKFEYDYVSKIRELNMKLPFFRVPKYVIIKDIVSYLNDDDIQSLAQTCKIFKTLIYSPFTLQILLTNKSLVNNKMQNISYIQSQYNILQQPFLLSSGFGGSNNDESKKSENSEDLVEQLTTLRTVKEFLTNKIRTLDEIIKSHQKEIAALKNEVKQGQSLDQKNMKKILALENRIKAYEFDKADHDDEVKNLNLQYQKLIKEKDTTINTLHEENINLKNEKERIGTELINVREKNEKLKNLNQQYHQALAKMKTIFNSNEFFNITLSNK